MWVFGYGSLVWRPSIPFDARVPAHLAGFARRFWQGSTDHRGVPGAPGRVVTLIEEPGSTCRGVAYAIPRERRDEVLARLDHREKGGYDRLEVRLRAPDGAELEALVYLATRENPNWLGPAPLETMAAQIRASRGPSGPNTEYVLELDRALRALGHVDDHVAAVAEAVRGLTGDGPPAAPAS